MIINLSRLDVKLSTTVTSSWSCGGGFLDADTDARRSASRLRIQPFLVFFIFGLWPDWQSNFILVILEWRWILISSILLKFFPSKYVNSSPRSMGFHPNLVNLLCHNKTSTWSNLFSKKIEIIWWEQQPFFFWQILLNSLYYTKMLIYHTPRSGSAKNNSNVDIPYPKVRFGQK
jgi:hypothetical protein